MVDTKYLNYFVYSFTKKPKKMALQNTTFYALQSLMDKGLNIEVFYDVDLNGTEIRMQGKSKYLQYLKNFFSANKDTIEKTNPYILEEGECVWIKGEYNHLNTKITIVLTL